MIGHNIATVDDYITDRDTITHVISSKDGITAHTVPAQRYIPTYPSENIVREELPLRHIRSGTLPKYVVISFMALTSIFGTIHYNNTRVNSDSDPIIQAHNKKIEQLGQLRADLGELILNQKDHAEFFKAAPKDFLDYTLLKDTERESVKLESIYAKEAELTVIENNYDYQRVSALGFDASKKKLYCIALGVASIIIAFESKYLGKGKLKEVTEKQ